MDRVLPGGVKVEGYKWPTDR